MKRLLYFAIAILALGSCCNTPEKSAGLSALDVIANRKSVRSYTEQKLSEDQIETLLRAAMAAPSGMNVQPWRFVVITDQEVKDALQGEARGPRKMYSEAAAIFVVCGETRFADREGQLRENGNWTADCAAATENLLLAAEAIGLGAVWTACYPYEERMSRAVEVLGIPEGITPYSVVPVGYPAGDETPKDKWKPENIHREKW